MPAAHLDGLMLVLRRRLADQVDLVLQNDDVLQLHDLHRRQMLCTRATSPVNKCPETPHDQKMSTTSSRSIVKHCNALTVYELIRLRTLLEG